MRLRVVEGPDSGAATQVGDRITIGTSELCDLRLTDPTVSRRHAAAEPGTFGIRFTDAGSRNGTWVGDCSLTDVELPPGTKLRLGSSWVVVELDTDRAQDGQTDSGESHQRFGRFLGASKRVQALYSTLHRVAPTDATILLEGESGTGKELLAEAIHEHSARASEPFVVVDCGAIAETLIEAELFGHEKGAFTGADRARPGAFERANGGTVFLDEIGELPINLQTRLLRLLDRRHVARIGSEQRIDVDVRIVAATNRDLEREVEESRFRLDLYHRLAVVLVRVPPLRERNDDIDLLAHEFARQLGAANDLLSADILTRLRSHRWAGNVRELRNYVERLVLLGDQQAEPTDDSADPFLNAALSGLPFRQARAQLLDAFTEKYIEDMLKRHNGNVSKAAESAGVARRYFYRLKGHA